MIIVTVIALVLGLLASLWYNLRRYFAAEKAVQIATHEAASEKALRESAEVEAGKQEAARLEAQAKARDRDVREATEVRESGNGQLAFDFLRNSFPDRKDSNDPR